MMDLDDNKKIRDPLRSDQLGNDFISLLQTHRTITWKERFDLHSETGSRGRSIGSSLREHEIPIVTIDTHDPRTRFPVPGVGGRYYTNIGVGKTYSGSKTKTMLYKEWLQAKLQHEPDEIVILLDSGDVLFGGCSEEELYSAYKAIVSASGGAPVVMGAGLDLWPYTLNMPQRYSQATTVQRRRAVQQLLGLSDNSYGQHANLTLCSEYWYPCSWPPVYQYLNAGFTMGPVKAIYKVFAEMLNEPDAVTGGWLTYISDGDGGFFHDQTAAAEWMLTHVDDITLDYTGALSIQMAKMNNPVSNKMLFMKDGMVHNNVTGLIQCFVHGNGPSEVFLPQLRKMKDESFVLRAAAPSIDQPSWLNSRSFLPSLRKMNFSHVAEMGDAHATSPGPDGVPTPALLLVFTSASVMMYIMILIMSVMVYIIFLWLGGNFCLWGASPFK